MSDYVTALILLMSYRDKQFLWYFSVQADIVNVI